MTARAEGEVLKAWREQRGLTQKDLASMAGLRATSIGAYERGQRRPDDQAVARICAALDVEPFRLFLDMARARADRIDPLVAELRSKAGRPSGSGRRIAELEWACGIVLHALQEILLHFAARLK